MTEAPPLILPFMPAESMLNRQGRDRLLYFFVEQLKKIELLAVTTDRFESTSAYDPSRQVTELQREFARTNDTIQFPEERLLALIIGYQNQAEKMLSIGQHDKAFGLKWADAVRDHCAKKLVRYDRFRDEEFSYVELGSRVIEGKEVERMAWRWFGQSRPNVSGSAEGVRAMDFQIPEDLIWAADYHLGFKATEVRKIWSDYVTATKNAVASPEIHDWNMQGGLWNVSKKRVMRAT